MGVPTPLGAKTPPTAVALPKVERATSVSRNPASRQVDVEIIEHHPAAPSWNATELKAASAASGRWGVPPASAGSNMENRPARLNASTVEGGSALAASASLAPAETTGATSSIATQSGSVSQSTYEEGFTS
jgi:hypothetical protein